MSRFWILAGAFAATAVTLAAALVLGSWGFNYRRFNQHETRLRRVMEQQPTIDRLTAGLEDEGAVVLSSPRTSEEVERAIARYGGDRAGALREKADRWVHLRVYHAADMIYFIFFDDEGVMRDFACVGA
ncbi:MAG: hypothetical protein PVJ73_14070 [Acidobacteriota bacterium]|jgi:hypothetical protein